MKNKKRRPKGMLPKKRRMYQNGGGVGNPPQGTITPQEVLARLEQLRNPDRLRTGDAPFRTIRQEKNRQASEGTDEAMFEFIRMFPVLGDAIDLVEAGKVNLTGKDLSGRETDKSLYNTFAAAGLVIPNVLERPLKFLLRKGARSADDIARVIRENRGAEELAPLKELQQKAEAFESRLIKGARPTRDALQSSGINFNTYTRPEQGAKNWMLENDPDLLMKFTPEAYDQGMFDRRMQEFGDQYLTMYRGVDADNPEQAARYMTEVQKGGNLGGQNAGPGIYGTSEVRVADDYGGYIGTVRTAPDVAQSFDPSDRIISDLVRLEEEGAMYLPIEERQLLSDLGAFPGMETRSDRVRVVRSLPASQQKILEITSPGEQFVPKYKSDFAGSNVSLLPGDKRTRGLQTAYERLFPLVEKYKNGGKVDGDPPQGTITPQDALMRALQPDNQFRLTGGDAPFRTIKQEQDRMTAETVDDSMFETARFLPVIGEGIDAAELAKVAATGEDFYGEEQDPAMFAGMTAAGYLIPNILEKPLKSAWRAVKKFPAKLPKREFRELPSEQREAVLQNLTQAHNEVYDMSPRLSDLDRDVFDLSGGSYNVRQLPSLMSGSKLENAVGKDGLIQVSQIENLINSKDISAAEREALQDALFKSRVQQGEALGLESGAPLPDKIDYLNFKRAGMGNMNRPFRVEESNQYADYGLGNLGYSFDAIPSLEKQGLEARTNLIRTTDPELQSTEYGHFGEDVIGHYRTFERPDEEGVLYISELQADPLQARGPAGEKRVGLNIGEGGPTTKQASLIKNQDQFLISHILENEAKGADKLRFPTGETTSKIQGYGYQTERVRRAREGVNQYEASVKAARENELVDKAIKEHPMFKGKSEDEVFEIWNTKLGSEDYNQQYARGFDEIGDSDFNMRRAFNEWASETSSLKGQREHLSRINASEQATQGIMKGYDRLPKALKKHGLDATKVTDDVGNTWWEVDIPARLGEGVGEIRAYNSGGKFRILKK